MIEMVMSAVAMLYVLARLLLDLVSFPVCFFRGGGGGGGRWGKRHKILRNRLSGDRVGSSVTVEWLRLTPEGGNSQEFICPSNNSKKNNFLCSVSPFEINKE